MSSAIASIAETARHFGVSPGTVRRWVRAGCPTLAPGSSGRGNGSLFDLPAVSRWRGQLNNPDETMELVRKVVYDVAVRDGGSGAPITHCLGISPEAAAILFSHFLSRLERTLKPFESGRFE